MSEYPICSTETRPVARKPHRCCECLRTIPAGERYRRFFGVWSEGPGDYKQCLDCATLFDKESGYDSRPVFTELWSHVKEIREDGISLWEAHARKYHLK